MTSPKNLTALPPELLFSAGQYLDVESAANACIASPVFNEILCRDKYFIQYLAKKYLTDGKIGDDEWQYIIGDIRHLLALPDDKKLIFAAERNYDKPVMEIVNSQPLASFSYIELEPIPPGVAVIPFADLPSPINDSQVSYTAIDGNSYSYLAVAGLIAAAYDHLPLFIRLATKAKESVTFYSDYFGYTIKTAIYNGAIDVLEYLFPSIPTYNDEFLLGLMEAALAGNNIDVISMLINDDVGVPTPQDFTSSNFAAEYLDSLEKFKWFFNKFPYADYSIYASVVRNTTGAGLAIAKYLYEEMGVPINDETGRSPEMEDYAFEITIPDWAHRITSSDDTRVPTIIYLIERGAVNNDFRRSPIAEIRDAAGRVAA